MPASCVGRTCGSSASDAVGGVGDDLLLQVQQQLDRHVQEVPEPQAGSSTRTWANRSTKSWISRSCLRRSLRVGLAPAGSCWPAPARDLLPEGVALPRTSAHSRRSGAMSTGSTQREDVVAAGVVGADLGPLGRVERALEERAEDRRLDLRPVISAASRSRASISSPSESTTAGRRRTARR
jgi:hypothetical protein